MPHPVRHNPENPHYKNVHICVTLFRDPFGLEPIKDLFPQQITIVCRSIWTHLNRTRSKAAAEDGQP